MRLLFVTQTYYPFLDKGGPTVKVRALARGMTASGHDVTVLSADLGFDPKKRKAARVVPGRWGVQAREDRVETIYLRSLAHYRSLTWNPMLGFFCRERLRDYDLAHIFGIYDLLGPTVADACRRIGRPYVLEPMGIFRPIVRNIWMKWVYHQVLGARLLKGASLVVATSEQERQELVESGIAPSKIAVRRNGIEVPQQLPALGAFRDFWKIQKETKLILFLGRLVSKKSPELMLEAFSRLRLRSNGSRKLLLVMAGPDEGDGYRQRLEARAANMGLDGNVLFTGPLYGNDKWSAYRDADVFVLPSQNENFGNTVAEAVACGTPVLVTDRCGIAPIVGQRAGLVVPYDCSALEAGLAQILDDAPLAARLRAGCKAVASSLGWAEPLSQMETIYREVLAVPRGQ